MADRFADIAIAAEERHAYDGIEFRAVDHKATKTMSAWSTVGHFVDGWFVSAGGGRSLGVYAPANTRPATSDEIEAFIRQDVGMARERAASEAADDAALAPLGLTTSSFYRFRGVYVEGDKIVVSTRGGGGNRECFCHEWAKPEERTDLSCGDPHHPQCVLPVQRALRRHPAYLYDEDDEGDCTYADFYFRKPDGKE